MTQQSAFLDIQFPEELVSFFDKKVQYVTSVSRMQSGTEFRKSITNSLKIYSLFKAIKRSEQISLFEDFFHIVQGKMYSFKMYDPSDCSIKNTEAIRINSKTFQIQKIISFNNIFKSWKITKPKNGTVQVFKDDALLISGYQVNFQTGEIYFTDEISSENPSQKITVSCEFFQHLRFNTDSIVFSMKGMSAFEVQDIEMVEVL